VIGTTKQVKIFVFTFLFQGKVHKTGKVLFLRGNVLLEIGTLDIKDISRISVPYVPTADIMSYSLFRFCIVFSLNKFK